MTDDRHDTGHATGDSQPDPVWERAVRAALDDPIPTDVLERSRALWELTTIDAELAELLAEESSDAELAGVRSATLQVTTFTFVAGDVTIEVEWDGAILAGQLFPAATAEIELHAVDGASVSATANSVGTFELTPPSAGTWCLVVVRRPDGSVRTPWFTL